MPLTVEDVESFLAEPRNVMVAAIRPDGRPQMNPLWFHWDGAKFYIASSKARRKYRNLLRDPRVQLAVDVDTGYKTVLLDGTVEIDEDVAAQLDMFRRIRVKYGRTPPADEELLEELRRDERVMLVITPDRPIEEWTRWGSPSGLIP